MFLNKLVTAIMHKAWKLWSIKTNCFNQPTFAS